MLSGWLTLRDWRGELAACEDDRERLQYATDMLADILDCSAAVGGYKLLYGLTPTEARMLHRLARHPGFMVPIDALTAMLHEDTDVESMRVHILRIRRKAGVSILNVHGQGYILETRVPFTDEEIAEALA